MASRFASNLLTLLVGGLMLTTALALTPATIGWIALAGGCAVVLVVLVAFPLGGRGTSAGPAAMSTRGIRLGSPAGSVAICAPTRCSARYASSGTRSRSSASHA